MTLIVALNAGSSSFKFGLFAAAGTTLETLLRGRIEEVDGACPLLRAKLPSGVDMMHDLTGAVATIDQLLAWIEARQGEAVAAVGHRVVHGGREFRDPVRIDPDVLDRLEALTPLAPLHQPASLAPIRALARSRPELPQFACFDTAFHHDLAPPVSRYPLPRWLEEQGVRRYGFHGLSYEAIAGKLAGLGDGARSERVIVAHLGSGASLCAMQDLKSVDTTMGFTALDGIMMGTRPGTLDPGILLYLIQQKGYNADELERLLYHESGLLGVSGSSSDVAVLLASDHAAAHEALDLFAFRIARESAALAGSIGGLDRFVFTGGIGEHAAPVRAMVAARLGWLGAELDDGANQQGATTISTANSRIRLQVLATDEESVIARHVAGTLQRSA